MTTKTRTKRCKACKPRIADCNAMYRLLNKVTPFDAGEVTRLAMRPWIEWNLLKCGQGTETGVTVLKEVMNASLVNAETVKGDPDELCINMVKRGLEALQIVIDRHTRIGSWGVCWKSLEHIPPVLEFHDQLLKTCTPAQLMAALKEANRRSDAGHVLEGSPMSP